MAFCSSCGTQVADGVKFCTSCGKAVGGEAAAVPAAAAAPAAPSKSATEKVGNIRKCPACGAEIGSFQAQCPSCGHELNSVSVAGSVKGFANKLVELESGVQSGAEQKQVAHSILIRAGIIIVMALISAIVGWNEIEESDNYLILIIGFIVTAFCALIIFSKVKLTQAAKQETMLIETFPIPTSKEDLFEFLILASSKISPAVGFGHGSQLQRHWNKVWNVKCRQIKTKADLAFSGDAQSMTTVDSLLEKSNKLIAQQKTSSGIFTGAVAAVILAAVGAVCFFALGYNIKVPDSVTIAPENVEVTGPFADVLKVVGDGVTMRSIDGGKTLTMSIEFEVMENLAAYTEARIQKEIKKLSSEKKWNTRDVIIYEFAKLDYKTGGISTSVAELQEGKAIFDSICKLEPGAVKKFNSDTNVGSGSGWHSKGTVEDRKATAKAMSVKTLSVRANAAEFYVTNQTRKEAGKDYYEQMELK